MIIVLIEGLLTLMREELDSKIEGLYCFLVTESR